uniref:glycoside hydrolase family 97 protein n=2 Tax=Flavobacterium sp. TaxID=239 RepID=UPI00404980E3
MKSISFLFCILFFGLTTAQNSLLSPDKNIKLNFQLAENGVPTYQVFFKNKEIIKSSSLGLKLKNESQQLLSDFMIESVENKTFNENWTPVLGENSSIQNHYQELKVFLKQAKSDLKMILVFRVFDDGVAFRYEIPTQANLNYFVIADEKSSFNLTFDYHTFWIPGDYDSQEYEYNETALSKIDATAIDLNNGIGMKGPIAKKRVQSPLMMKGNGLYLNIFEAAVRNYPIMHLDVSDDLKISSHLVPNALGDKAYLQAPANTPWRTILVSDDARKILASNMILNLNEPSKIENTSWIKPMKYVGIWWEMHVGKATWDYAGSQNGQNIQPNELKATGKHGATTENAKRYIDFAAKHGFDGVLIEGWNVGWEDWFGNWKEEVFDFVTPYPDFDIKEVTTYAASKGVKLIMHHETSGSVANYERRLDRAFKFMKDYQYDAVKTGYVGRIIPRGEWHDGQTMVNHFEHVLKRAADYEIMVNSHESVRPSGLNRTFPNFIASEAARGNEFNAWSVGNPPMHETILPFTRLMGGPMDYTPGIFEIQMSHYDASKTEQVHTTLAKQLALYVTMYSPLQMAADLPENYERYLDAFQFIKDVPADWSETRILEAEPGDFVTIVRKDKNSDSWFLGAITDENARKTTLILDFLDANKKYEATIYEDGTDADWKTNPKSYKIRKVKVSAKDKLKLQLANGGGVAISFRPIN